MARCLIVCGDDRTDFYSPGLAVLGKPNQEDKMKHVIEIHGKLICEVEVNDLDGKKEYFEMIFRYPDGSWERKFVSWKRLYARVKLKETP